MTTWPLGRCISLETFKKLAAFQQEEYGTVLEIPDPVESMESLEEVDRLIRQAPSRSRD